MTTHADFAVEAVDDDGQWSTTTDGIYPIGSATQAAVDSVVAWLAGAINRDTLRHTARVSATAVDLQTGTVVTSYKTISPSTPQTSRQHTAAV